MTELLTYLDYNATAPVRPEAIAAMADAFGAGGNPSSVHGAGRLARRALESARERIAAAVNVDPAQVIFTSGGTEANNLALAGFPGHHLVISAIEHGSVMAPALMFDPHATIVAVDADGILDLSALERALAATPVPALVSVMLANNETGVVQPVADAARIAHRFGALLHCDAVQGLGKIPVDIAALGADLVTLSAHKLGGPLGAGALALANGAAPKARSLGGGQERGRRAGTENVPAIVGFAVAVERALADGAAIQTIAALRNNLERRVLAAAPGARVVGVGAPRLPNTSCLVMPGVASETQVMALDLAGIAVSAGAACSSGKVARSHVLAAMGLDDAVAGSAIRVSLGWRSSAADIDRLVAAWTELYARTRTNRAPRAAANA